MLAMKPGNSSAVAAEADLLVVAAAEGIVLRDAAAEVDAALHGALLAHLTQVSGGSGVFDGSPGNVVTFPTFGRISSKAVMVVGLGDAGRVDAEAVRRAAGVAARNSGGFASVVLDIGGGVQGGARAAAEGFQLGSYSFGRYLSKQPKASERLVVSGATKAELKLAETYCEAALWARDLVNEPPSGRGPEVVAEQAKERASKAGLKVKILDEAALAKLGMNGILTVGRGSDSPPRLLILTYEPRGAKGFVGLIGKGITFDSGGLSIKSGEGMETMKMDCSGGAAVIAAMTALPALAPKIKVVAAVALAENMPGGNAVKPGDVIRHYGGHTSEVLNTDAEGRLVLADALAWMSEQKPDAMVNIATLTGAMAVALGTRVAGVLSNRPELSGQLLEASKRTGEPLWEMPLVEDYRKLMKSTVADIKNISGIRQGGAITAGLFLKDFVGETPWAHLDIAGPAWVDKPEHYLSAGATGYGTRLLLDWITSRAG
ncbi:MAG TPA: leucyl aminopeptidase [Actinomycetota bacterium]|nr:leucyl aminopeptidase [Actinomycetota bacterium]